MDLLKDTVLADRQIFVEEVVGELLTRKGLTICTAESCTGGLIGHLLTQVAGSSAYFKGSLVAYHNQIKISELNVLEELIVSCGAVSKEVVCAMAINAKKKFFTDFSVATSGIAGPGGGTDEKPVGLVHLAVAHKTGVEHKKCLFGDKNRSDIKTASALTALKMLQDKVSSL